ncbi:MFS transporter [Luedemannella helvata]|uniref:MFS transporter n=1 Tax=Luedemannella helvata TaxID=349315 RepID=A0ABN2K9Z3_9ACTN
MADAWRADFRRLWLGTAVSTVGNQVSLLALPLTAAVVLGAGPVEMGVLTALNRAPYLALGLVVGVWVDRIPRRTVLVAAALGLAATLGAIPTAAALGRLSLPLLYATALLAGTQIIFLEVASLAAVPMVVPPEHRPATQRDIELTMSGAQLLGPALGGALVQALTAPIAIAFDAVTYLVAALAATRLRAGRTVAARPAGRAGLLAQISEGVRLVTGERVLRAVTLATATFVFWTTAYTAILVLFLVRDVGLGAGVLGAVLACGAVGGITGAALAGPLGRRLGSGRAMATGLITGGLGAALAPLSLTVPPPAAAFVVALSQALMWGGQQAHTVHQVPVRYALCPDHLHGRVNATIRTTVWGSSTVGALLGGVLGATIGLPATLAATGVAAALAAGWIVASPARRLRSSTDLISVDTLPAMVRILLVPGLGQMLPEHWMSRWAREHPEYEPVPRDDDPGLDIDLRVAALHKAVTAADQPVVLVAHSGGCITVTEWAAQHTGPVAAALIVAPPYLDPDWDEPDPTVRLPPVNRLDPLPFPTVVVASRTDPICPYERAEEMAAAWGARLVDAGDAGHLNTAAGYGPWPAGERLLADLLDRVR